jgi:hypothetical protein
VKVNRPTARVSLRIIFGFLLELRDEGTSLHRRCHRLGGPKASGGATLPGARVRP